ncbi:hypothetical protein DVS77_27905 [Mycolicibacterium moriokaense]|nr:hypothetical protein DVS77_27905 [Mycolicibacterium moriokaense]
MGEDDVSDRAVNRGLFRSLIVAAGLSSALILSPPAAAKWPAAEPCVSSDGLTLRQQYGYSAAVITSDCTQVQAGERWAVSVPWIMDSRFEQKPPGFVTDYASPLDDFRGRLQSIDVVVDAGSAYQSNRSYPGDNKIWVGELPTAPGLPAVDSVGLGSLDPLPVGRHAVEVYWNLRAPVCDGFTADQATSCLPAGKTLVKRIGFTVVAPHEQSQGT